MQHAWMLRNSNKKNLIFLFFFLNFTKNFVNYSFSNVNFFFFLKLKYFFKLNTFFDKFVKDDFKIESYEKNKLSPQETLMTDSIIGKETLNKNFYLLKNNKNIKTNGFVFNTNKEFYYKLLNFFFLNSFLPHNSFFPRSGFFKFFFFKNSKGSAYIINLSKVMNRWKDFFNLSLNIYLMNLNPLVYSTPFFKNETLALNWNLNIWDVRSWKLTYPYFIFKTNHFSQATDYFYNKLNETDNDLFIVTDCLYHFKNLYFFKKNFFYTVGLVSLNVNPWIVSYPVIASSNSYLNQIFFLQALVYSQRKAFFLNFSFFKKVWNNLIVSKLLY